MPNRYIVKSRSTFAGWYIRQRFQQVTNVSNNTYHYHVYKLQSKIFLTSSGHTGYILSPVSQIFGVAHVLCAKDCDKSHILREGYERGVCYLHSASLQSSRASKSYPAVVRAETVLNARFLSSFLIRSVLSSIRSWMFVLRWENRYVVLTLKMPNKNGDEAPASNVPAGIVTVKARTMDGSYTF